MNQRACQENSHDFERADQLEIENVLDDAKLHVGVGDGRMAMSWLFEGVHVRIYIYMYSVLEGSAFMLFHSISHFSAPQSSRNSRLPPISQINHIHKMSGPGACYAFNDGNCQRGESCRFSHGDAAPGGGGGGGGARRGGGECYGKQLHVTLLRSTAEI
jgi:hypothetical protein